MPMARPTIVRALVGITCPPQDTGRLQLGYQVLAMVVTMGIALSWGTLIGWLASWLNPTNVPELLAAELFDDGPWCVNAVLLLMSSDLMYPLLS